ncbi:glycosyltransferase family 2 protein [Mangrovimonas xylaniphaga]|uniref:glycosyltransferase family 2 protein n=1 Tax=Mangrovimonas xylaniphaga TaxID=1645915 RepID=UPI001F0AA59A|nr:glycosyltransferase family A protein [Mangrovimonas xylaniphaga]
MFPISDELPKDVIEQLDLDTGYSSKLAQAYDLSWQAIQRGYIGNAKAYAEFQELAVTDEYRFIRKYFHSAWVLYVLVLRLFSFKNPLMELKAWFGTQSVSRVSYSPLVYSEWSSVSSELIAKLPFVSVVIPTLNRYEYLDAILRDLEQQTYPHFEVIIVDQSDAFQADFYSQYQLDIQLVRQKEKALWLARNTAIQRAKGSLIALSEDDVRVAPDWLESHLRCLDFFNAEVSAGVFHPEGQQIPQDRSFFAVSSQFATGNAVLYRKVFKEVGLFDRQFEKQRMGDGEFGCRVYLSGVRSVSNPFASCVDVKAGVGGLREMGSWDAFRPTNFFAPRPIPSVLYYFRRYYGNKMARLAILRTVPLSVFPYQFKQHKLLLVVGFFVSILLLPLVCYQVWRSWRLSSQKLKEGPIIGRLKSE